MAVYISKKEAIKEVIMQIVDAIKKTLEETPTDLASDIMVNGITITGGCALIKNFDRLIALETGIPVNIAKDPLDCMVKGCSAVLDNLNELKPMLVNTKKIKYQKTHKEYYNTFYSSNSYSSLYSFR